MFHRMVFHIQQQSSLTGCWASTSPLIPLQAQPLLPPPMMVIWVPFPPPEMIVEPAAPLVDLLDEDLIPLLVADFQMEDEEVLDDLPLMVLLELDLLTVFLTVFFPPLILNQAVLALSQILLAFWALLL